MVERYIELNEFTRPYIVSLKNPGPEDLKIIRGLVHDRKWWSGYNRESPAKKLEMLGGLKEKFIQADRINLESKINP